MWIWHARGPMGGVDLEEMSVQRSLWKTLWASFPWLMAFWTPAWPLWGLTSPTSRSLDPNLTGDNHVTTSCVTWNVHHAVESLIRKTRMYYVRDCFLLLYLFFTNILPCQHKRFVGNRLDLVHTIREELYFSPYYFQTRLAVFAFSSSWGLSSGASRVSWLLSSIKVSGPI